MMHDMATLLQRIPVIPVIVIEDIDTAVPLCEALFKGGLSVQEITLRSDFALQAIADVKAAIPEVIIGAGTVLNERDVAEAVTAGAEFLVSPGVTTELIEAIKHADVAWLPGVCTASEVMRMLVLGVDTVKFFPAEAAGGRAMLNSLLGPLPQIKFCPTGGIHLGNAAEYLALDNVLCVGGSWMLDEQLIASKDWKAIEDLAKEAAALT